MTTASNNFIHLNQEVMDICHEIGRNHPPLLLAVSKTRSADEIKQAYNAGFTAFGENYLQEALEKIAILSALDIQWHFIGNIQSNKAKLVAENFSWAHTVDRLKVARKLSEARPAHMPPLDICIQVNIDEDPAKSGIVADEVPALANAIKDLPGLRLRGLMTVPANNGPGDATRSFARLAETLERLKDTIPDLDTLSMGMSGDYKEAIECGATIIRLGTAVFGPRPAKQTRGDN